MPQKFNLPEIIDNENGWGPVPTPVMFTDMPYQTFSKSDPIGKVADWTGTTYKDRRTANKYNSQFGSQCIQYAYYHEDDDSSFQLVDTTKTHKPIYHRARFSRMNQRSNYNRRQQTQQVQALTRVGKGRERERNQQVRKWQKQMKHKYDHHRHGNQNNHNKNREASITVRPTWRVLEEMDFTRLGKLSLPGIHKPNDVYRCGTMGYFDKSFQNVNLNSWDIVVHKINDIVFLDRRNNEFTHIPVNETAIDPPYEEANSINSLRNLALEATYINHNFSQQVLKNEGEKVSFENPNPFVSDDAGTPGELASIGYRYRQFDLGDEIGLVVRCEHDGVMIGPNGETQYINIKALNEWDPRYSGGIDWRQKLDSQRGAVLANELKNNSCKLAKWTVQAILAGSHQIKFGYVSRVHVKGTAKHVILGTQQFRPREFAEQINLSMDNAWGILRFIIDTCLKLENGKYLFLKDPHKPVLRLYDIPNDSFESDESDMASNEEDNTTIPTNKTNEESDVKPNKS
ncbi:eukaryotic translation initiation factor 3 subunit D isoform 1 [Tropilaelaps mercedesae]|uniref:Eukaryotic translation initiation factor 3 subunit D n=1 Tax=Tropilaelaps mercedesae TaxID=418985 RepID=A0A1V9Y0L8_9ACAR|nr:eukaryotic translation initiation factor 3 subunit D isoform 1 [Tropilaelaps mercedesae]